MNFAKSVYFIAGTTPFFWNSSFCKHTVCYWDCVPEDKAIFIFTFKWNEEKDDSISFPY